MTVPLMLRWFGVCPRISKEGGKLVATSAWRVRVLTLWAFYRRVTIDPARAEVVIARRYLWLFARRRRVRFAAVGAIAYGYQDWGGGAGWWAHDSSDWFSVGLRLRSGDDVHLFHFYGDGGFTNDGPLPNWLYWDRYLTDTTGTQERESRAYVELLSRMIGVRVEPAR